MTLEENQLVDFIEDRFRLFRDEWYVKDHLGNVRSVINLSKDSDAPVSDVILEQNDYLPYGTKVSDASLQALPSNRYRYAGKEEQRFGGFDFQLLDFGARYYDPWSCQWTAVDPMAEKSISLGLFSYCSSNPVNRFDPMGFTDYYSVNTGKLLDSVDDNCNDKMFVLNHKLTVEEAKEKGSLFPVPTADVLNAMETVFENTEATGNEYGFQVDCKGNTGDIGKGDESSIKDIPYVYSKTGNYVAYDVHSHPKQGEECQYDSNATPSKADMQGTVGTHPNVVLGFRSDLKNSPTIGNREYETTKMIGWYNSSGPIGNSISFSSFKSSVRRALKSK